MRRLTVLTLLVLMLGLVAIGPATGKPPATTPAADAFHVAVVSSAADQVTGGDARLHIDVPRTVPFQQVGVLVNHVDQRSHFTRIPGTRTLTGVIDGLPLGVSSVTIRANGQGQGRPAPVTLTLTNYPITGPVFSGPHQYPFVCTTAAAGLGPPIADNLVTGTIVPTGGFSLNCSV